MYSVNELMTFIRMITDFNSCNKCNCICLYLRWISCNYNL